MKVPASLLNAYSFCPRSLYLSSVMGLEPDSPASMERGVFSQELRKGILLKQMELQGTVDDPSTLIASLKEELDISFSSIRQDHPLLDDVSAREVLSEVTADLGSFFNRLNYIADDIGFEKALSKLTPWRVDYEVSSSALGLCGRVDKVMKEHTYYPVEIKTCVPPESVWEGDRLQVCAYGLLLEESLTSKRIPHGFIEYTRIPDMRPVLFTDALRKRVLDTKDAVCELLKGDVPDICPHGNGRKCDSCSYARKCYEV